MTGKGLALRMDHDMQYTANNFLKKKRVQGIDREFRPYAEFQTYDVAGRFHQTLRGQAIHGRLFRNLEEVRRAAKEFTDRYNHRCHLEKFFSHPRSPVASCYPVDRMREAVDGTPSPEQLAVTGESKTACIGCSMSISVRMTAGGQKSRNTQFRSLAQIRPELLRQDTQYPKHNPRFLTKNC